MEERPPGMLIFQHRVFESKRELARFAEVFRTQGLLLHLQGERRGLLLVPAVLPKPRTEPGPWERHHRYLLNDVIKKKGG